MSYDRSKSRDQVRAVLDGHDAACAQRGPLLRCGGCYSATACYGGTMRPRTMEAAYALLPAKARGLMARYAIRLAVGWRP